jgi:hypothetical protein
MVRPERFTGTSVKRIRPFKFRWARQAIRKHVLNDRDNISPIRSRGLPRQQSDMTRVHVS